MEDPAQWKARIELIRQCMPKVAALIADERKKYGDAHVVECQRRGMAGEPGWFFAQEGSMAIGTPWLPEQDSVLAEQCIRWNVTPTQALVILRKPEVRHGA